MIVESQCYHTMKQLQLAVLVELLLLSLLKLGHYMETRSMTSRCQAYKEMNTHHAGGVKGKS